MATRRDQHEELEHADHSRIEAAARRHRRRRRQPLDDRRRQRPLWRELQSLGLLEAQGGWLLALSLAGMLATALYALLSLVAWRPVLKPVIVVLLFASALGAHFMWTYHVVIDAAMAANTLQTDWHEVQDLVTPRLGLVLLVGAAVPSWMVWNAAVDHRPWRQQALRNLTGRGGEPAAAGRHGAAELPAAGVDDAQPQGTALPAQPAQLRVCLGAERLRAAEHQGAGAAGGTRRESWSPAQARGRACWCWSWARPVAAATSA